MTDEVYFMHCCFGERIDEVVVSIEGFGYGKDEIKVNNRQSLVPIHRSGIKIIWLCVPPSTTTSEDLKPLYSEIDYRYDDVFQCPTEVKITCSDDKYLLDYLEKLAVDLWTNLTEWKQTLLLPHPKRKPYFTSLIDYYRKHPSKIPSVVEKNVNKEGLEFPEVLSDISKMKKYYRSYSLVTAKEIYDAIPKAWDSYNRELGGQWGPETIAKNCNSVMATVSRYLGAFAKAGITKITYKGDEIPIPHRSSNRS
jgi:hypothetical protein